MTVAGDLYRLVAVPRIIQRRGEGEGQIVAADPVDAESALQQVKRQLGRHHPRHWRDAAVDTGRKPRETRKLAALLGREDEDDVFGAAECLRQLYLVLRQRCPHAFLLGQDDVLGVATFDDEESRVPEQEVQLADVLVGVPLEWRYRVVFARVI